MKVLLVDNDDLLIELVCNQLIHENCIVEVTQRGQDALELVQQDSFDVILLDVVLPDISGIQVCQILRSQGVGTPILILTGKNHVTDKVAGLDAGADDYLVKPFALEELAARVRALIRRDSEVIAPVLTYGDLSFDTVSRNLTYKSQFLHLRPKELAIMELMLRYPKNIFNSDTLLDRLWPLADCPGKATIKAHILSLRKQLKAVGAPDIIETLYGQGYRLNPAYVKPEQPVPTLLVIGETDFHDDLTLPLGFSSQTWEQVQPITRNQLSHLKDLLTKIPNRQTAEDAIEIACQLQKTLGSFGLSKAAIYAQCIEVLLTNIETQDVQIFELLQGQINALHHELAQQVENHPFSANLPQTNETQVLAVVQDIEWGEKLWKMGQDFPFQLSISFPLDFKQFCVESIPQVVLLELDTTKPKMNTMLLAALSSMYGSKVSILCVIDDDISESMTLALQYGVKSFLSKKWSTRTLLTVVSEYVSGKKDAI